MSEKKTTPYADFGKRLTKLREEKGMTKQELAGLCQGFDYDIIIEGLDGARVDYFNFDAFFGQLDIGCPVKQSVLISYCNSMSN